MSSILTRRVITLATSGASLRDIGHETGLLDKEIRVILDAHRQSSQTVATIPAPPVRPVPSLMVKDELSTLLEQADAAGPGKVQTAAKRVRASVDALRKILADTEQERREKAARDKAIAEAKSAAQVAQAQLDAAKAKLAELDGRHKPKSGRTNDISPEGRERMRQNAIAMQARLRAKREAAKSIPSDVA